MPDLHGDIDATVMAALNEAVDKSVYGNRTGDMRGVLRPATVYDELTVDVIYATPPIYPGDWWFIDNGLPVPPPEPTPVERALALLDPHLRACPLYKAGPPVLYPNWPGPA